MEESLQSAMEETKLAKANNVKLQAKVEKLEQVINVQSPKIAEAQKQKKYIYISLIIQ